MISDQGANRLFWAFVTDKRYDDKVLACQRFKSNVFHGNVYQKVVFKL